MTATIVAQPTTTDLSELVLSYLQRTNEAAITLPFVEAMCAELDALIAKTGDDEIEDAELRYAYLVAADEPVGFDALPAALWPN